jgi:hypothetical protein
MMRGSHMIERVAEAIAHLCERPVDANEVARVAIEAMREPTTQMEGSALQALAVCGCDDCRWNMGLIWRSMITAALN